MESNRTTPVEKPRENPEKKMEQETIVATLVDLPRLKVQLIKFEFGAERHFLLRRTKWLTSDIVRGSEIKLDEPAARVLIDALGAALLAPRARDAYVCFCCAGLMTQEQCPCPDHNLCTRAHELPPGNPLTLAEAS